MGPIAGYATDFADQAVLLPLAIAVAVIFAAAGWRRGAVAWMAIIGAALGLTLLLKLAFLACGHLLPGGVQSPSGHTAAAGAIYGGLLAIMARHVTGQDRWALPCAAVVAVVIGASRLVLGVHTILEVCIGGLVGICGAMAAAKLAGPPPPEMKVRAVAALVIAVLVLFHGFHMPAEAAIRRFAFQVWPLSTCR